LKVSQSPSLDPKIPNTYLAARNSPSPERAEQNAGFGPNSSMPSCHNYPNPHIRSDQLYKAETTLIFGRHGAAGCVSILFDWMTDYESVGHHHPKSEARFVVTRLQLDNQEIGTRWLATSYISQQSNPDWTNPHNLILAGLFSGVLSLITRHLSEGQFDFYWSTRNFVIAGTRPFENGLWVKILADIGFRGLRSNLFLKSMMELERTKRINY
jgi:hypothetical protein